MQHNSASEKKYSSMTDEQLVALCRKGEDLIPVIISRYASVVRMKAASMNVSLTERDDLMQEGFLGLISAVRSFNPDKNASFPTYANRCIANKIISALPKQSEEVLDDENECEPDNNTPESIFFSKLLSEEIARVMSDELSDMEREVFRLFLKGETYEEMAKSLGLNVKTVDNALQRVRKKLKSAWKTEINEK